MRVAIVKDYSIVNQKLYIKRYEYTNPFTSKSKSLTDQHCVNLPTNFAKNTKYEFENIIFTSKNRHFGKNTRPLFYKIASNATNNDTIIVSEYSIFKRAARRKHEILSSTRNNSNNSINNLKDIDNDDTRQATILMVHKCKIGTKNFTDILIVYLCNETFNKNEYYRLSSMQQTDIQNSIKMLDSSIKPTYFILDSNSINLSNNMNAKMQPKPKANANAKAQANAKAKIGGGRKIRRGPRGGKYYMKGGNKVYVK